jgi:hypothetical protein
MSGPIPTLETVSSPEPLSGGGMAARVAPEKCRPGRQEFSSDRRVEPWWAQRVGREALRTLSLIRWFRSTRPGVLLLPARLPGAFFKTAGNAATGERNG